MKARLISLFKFCLVGAANTGIDFSIFAFLTFIGWSYLPSQLVSYSSGVLNSYLLNRTWTFQGSSRPSYNSFYKFVALNLLLLLFSTGIITLLHQGAGWPVLISKLCANGAGFLMNYAGNRLWVFAAAPNFNKGVIDREN